MKKILFIVLSVIMLSSVLLISCGEPAASPTTTTPPTTKPPTTAPPTTAPPTTAPPTTAPPTTTTGGLGDLAKPAGGIAGGRLQQALGSAVLNLSDITQGAGPVDAFYAFPVVEPLLRLDGNQNFQPWLAERFEIAADFSFFTLYLRHGGKFPDGPGFKR